MAHSHSLFLFSQTFYFCREYRLGSEFDSWSRSWLKVNQELVESSLSRAQRSQSVLSSLSLQDSQVQFYDAIEYLTSESESDDSDDGSDDGSGSAPKPISPAIVPGILLIIHISAYEVCLNFYYTSGVVTWELKKLGKETYEDNKETYEKYFEFYFVLVNMHHPLY